MIAAHELASENEATMIGVLDHVYDIPVSRLFMIGLALATANCAIPPIILYFIGNLGVAFWAGILCSVALTMLVAVSLLSHGKRALWLTSITPFGLIWPTLYVWVLYACFVKNDCL